MHTIFISYLRDDAALVHPIAEALRARGHSIWLDVWQNRPGDNWRAIQDRALDDASCVLGFWSKNALSGGREEFKREWYWSDIRRVYVPILLDDTRPQDFGAPFGGIQFDKWGSDFYDALDALEGNIADRIAISERRRRSITSLGEIEASYFLNHDGASNKVRETLYASASSGRQPIFLVRYTNDDHFEALIGRLTERDLVHYGRVPDVARKDAKATIVRVNAFDLRHARGDHAIGEAFAQSVLTSVEFTARHAPSASAMSALEARLNQRLRAPQPTQFVILYWSVGDGSPPPDNALAPIITAWRTFTANLPGRSLCLFVSLQSRARLTHLVTGAMINPFAAALRESAGPDVVDLDHLPALGPLEGEEWCTRLTSSHWRIKEAERLRMQVRAAFGQTLTKRLRMRRLLSQITFPLNCYWDAAR